jgi:hypothetical protein
MPITTRASIGLSKVASFVSLLDHLIRPLQERRRCASAASGAARRAAEITPMNARRSMTGPTPNAVGQSGAKEDGA